MNITKKSAKPMNHRQLLFHLGLSFLVTLLVACTGNTAQDEATNTVELLFVQTAQEASLAGGVLKLSDVGPSTLYFSDRPERIVGHIPTDVFVAEWGKGEDSFATDPPNAALSILSGPEAQEIVVVLKAPRLEKNDLVYDVEVLEGKKTASGSASSLFIDTIGRPMSPTSFAGRHRRHRRSVIRRHN